MSSLEETVAELRRLLKAATPGDWDNRYSYSMVRVGDDGSCCHCVPDHPIVKQTKRWHIHRTILQDDYYRQSWHQVHNEKGVGVAGNYDYEEGGIIREEDSDLIVAMKNALPMLLDAIDPPKKKRAIVLAKDIREQLASEAINLDQMAHDIKEAGKRLRSI